MFYAEVRAPQGGPVYVHHFEGASVVETLRTIADALDLDRAEQVEIVITGG